MESLVRWQPFRELASIEQDMKRLFDSFFRRAPLPLVLDERFDPWRFAPPTDIYEDADALTIRIEIPGMEQKDLKIELEADILKVQGERRLEKDIKKENFRRMERRYGMFARSFTLPNTVDKKKIVAKYVRGVLTVHIPKRKGAVAKIIKINPAKALPKVA